MPKVVACIIARTVSTRLPLKVLRDIRPGETMLEFLIDRVQSIKSVDAVYLCTSTESVDDILVDVAVRKGVSIYRGSAKQVIERMLAVGKLEQADYVLRITGDNPLTSVEYVDEQVKFVEEGNLDYARLIKVPIGATAEVIKMTALQKCFKLMDPDLSEYMMLYLFDPETFRCGVITIGDEDYSALSFTVDTSADLDKVRAMLWDTGERRPQDFYLKDLILANISSGMPTDVDGDTLIKMPHGKEIRYGDFQLDMRRRIEKSAKLALP